MAIRLFRNILACALALAAVLSLGACAKAPASAVLDPDPLAGTWSMAFSVAVDGKVDVFLPKGDRVGVQPAVFDGDGQIAFSTDGTWLVVQHTEPAPFGTWINDTDAYLATWNLTYDAWLESLAPANPGLAALQHYALTGQADGAEYTVTLYLFQDDSAFLTHEGLGTFFIKWQRAA